jgi:oligopeptide transport system permease protein
MIRFVAQRLIQTLPVIWVIITVTFFMIRFVPGGPFTAERAVTPEIMRNLEAHYGLNKPLYRQYLDYCSSILRGDLGPSFKYPTRSVNEIIADKLPVSAELGMWSLAVALGIGLPMGILAAVRRNTWVDYACSSAAMVGICIPTFVLGPLLILLLAIQFGLFNASGWYAPIDRVLPSVTLGCVYAAYVARLTRGGMLEILNQDFIRTARAKGASETRVVLRHALRGGLTPVVSFLGPAIAGVVTGSFVIETIFQIPGIGREFVNSALNRDYTLVLGTVIVYAAFIIAMNLVVDIVLVWMNPKLRFE